MTDAAAHHGPVTRPGPGPDAGPGGVDIGALERHVRQLTRFGPRHPDHPVAVEQALDHVTRSLTGWGYAVRREAYGPDPADVNLVAALPGTGAAPVVEVGAHWDTVSTSPGADDDASGVAGLLEVARLLATAPARGHGAPVRGVPGRDTPGRGVRFCVFGGEEGDDTHPPLAGSRAHVAALQGDVDRDVDGAIVLEMIGYRDAAPGSQRLPPDLAAALPPPVPDRGDFIAVLADPSAGRYLDVLATGARDLRPALPLLPLVVPPDAGGTAARSDHLAYWEAGIPAVMLSDTAEFRNPHYHRQGDLPGTLDLAFAAAVTAVVAGAVLRLAEGR